MTDLNTDRQLQNNTRTDLLIYLLLGLFLYIAFLPLSSFLHALKNDALIANFPNKYFFSAALHSGHLPLWNPYINFGLPLYADPGFAFWHPLTWVFGIIGYNPFTLSVEVLTYIWLGGIFMYRLGIHLGHIRLTAILMATLYMCCGFFIGNLSHINFLTGAAFLPLVTQNFLRLQKSFSVKNLSLTTLSLYLLLTAGHPALPFGTVYFLGLLFIGLLITEKTPSRKKELLKTIKINSLLLFALLGLTAPLYLSWLELWPQFNRSEPILQSLQQDLGFSPASYLSFLFPFATTANTNFFATDLSMRNGYFSFIGLALFITVLLQPKNKHQIIFLASGTMMLLLSLGGPLKSVLFTHLPLLQYIRGNGEYRVFALLSFIIVLSWPLDHLLTGKALPLFNQLLKGMVLLSAIVFFTTVLYCWKTRQLTLSDTTTTGFSGKIKWLLDHLPLAERLLINAGLLLLLLSLYFLLKKRLPSHQLIPAILMADLVIFCWLHLPVTGVQQKSPADITSYFQSVPPGIPIPHLSPIAQNKDPEGGVEKIIGCWSYYSKQPGTPELCNYPTLFNSTKNYFQSTLPEKVKDRPFVFSDKTDPASLTITAFTPTTLEIDASTSLPDTLILLQNYFHGWTAQLDDHPVPIKKEYLSFMGIAMPGGRHHFTFRFTSRLILYLCVSLLTGAILAGLSLYTGRSRHPLRR